MRPQVYQRFRPDAAPPAGRMIAILVVLAALISGLAIHRIQVRHRAVGMGYELSRARERVGQLREQRRRLEVERATLTNPDRIRALATAMGMTAVAPDRIRVVPAVPQVARGEGRP